MELHDVVAKYKQLAAGFGQPVALSAFGLSREETERVFSLFDEDYHISRFFHFSLNPVTEAGGPAVVVYEISGFRHTHVSLDAEIEAIL